MKHYLKMILSFTFILWLAPTLVLAQANTCPEIVSKALSAADAACSLWRRTVSSGNQDHHASFRHHSHRRTLGCAARHGSLSIFADETGFVRRLHGSLYPDLAHLTGLTALTCGSNRCVGEMRMVTLCITESDAGQ